MGMTWIVIVIFLLLYLIVLIHVNDSFWHSYVESPCFIVNSTVVERECCSGYCDRPEFDAVWILDVHFNGFNSTRYLADIQQIFNSYYEAYEAILTLHPVSVPLCQLGHLI